MGGYGDRLHLKNISTGAETTDIMWVVRRGSVVPVQLGFELSGGDFTLTDGDLTVNGDIILTGEINPSSDTTFGGDLQVSDRTTLAEYDTDTLPSGWTVGTEFVYSAGRYVTTGTGGAGTITTDINVTAGREYIVLMSMSRSAGSVRLDLNGSTVIDDRTGTATDNTGWTSGFRMTKFRSQFTEPLVLRCNATFNDGINYLDGLKVYEVSTQNEVSAEMFLAGNLKLSDFPGIDPDAIGLLLGAGQDIYTAGVTRYRHFVEHDYGDTAGDGSSSYLLVSGSNYIQLGAGVWDVRIGASDIIDINYSQIDVDTVIRGISKSMTYYDAQLDVIQNESQVVIGNSTPNDASIRLDATSASYKEISFAELGTDYWGIFGGDDEMGLGIWSFTLSETMMLFTPTEIVTHAPTKLQSQKANETDLAATNTLSILDYTDINITAAGVTLTLSNLTDGATITVRDESGSGFDLAHDIFLTGTLYTSPATIPANATYCLTWDATNNRFKF